MKKRKNFSKWIFTTGAASGIALTLFLVAMAQTPDTELRFEREVPSHSNPDRIDRLMSSVTRWPQWFYSLSQAKITTNQGSSTIEKGALIVLNIDPHKGEKKKFQLTAEVTRYLPGQALGLKIIQDSSGRLTRLFDHLEWNIEILPKEKGSVISGTVIAHTHHWRSRLFGQIAKKVMLNQIFYPNLVKLAEMQQPFSTEIPPQPGQPQTL